MKNTFENPVIEIVTVDNEDILLCSGTFCPDEYPSDVLDDFDL